MEPGSKLFVYTDGVPEATNEEKNMFGTANMVDALNANKDKTPAEILQGVKEAVDAFVKSAPQFDDLTMLCLEYKGASNVQ
jgi:serine phosphatase RsbU (regulator of sigma subunit)